MTISEAYMRYDQQLQSLGRSLKTRKNYRTSLNSFLKSCGDIPVGLITFDIIGRWQLVMSSGGMQSSTIKSNLTTLREVLKFLRLAGVQVIDSRDIKLPSVAPRSPVWLDYSEIQGIMSVIESPRDKALVAALFASGARISELLSLNRDSIVDKRAFIIGKGDKPGVLYFDDISMRYIKAYLDTRKDDLRPLFISGQYRRITVQRVEQLLHVYGDQARIDKNVTPHVFRHSFASNLVQNGADIFATSKLLRHSNISTTMIYAHIKEEQNALNYQKYHTIDGR